MTPTHTPVDLTDEQRANLAKLAAYLRTLPADYPDFEMRGFVREGDRTFAHIAGCGTAACAVGHGPKAGIEPLRGESWFAYSYRTFVPVYVDGCEVNGRVWDWCFASSWARVDNTVHGAAARIEYMLAHGVPDDAFSQMCGNAPLCYTLEYQSALAALNAETNEMVALSNGRLG